MGAAASQHSAPPSHPSTRPPPPLGPRPSTARLSYDLPLSSRRDLRPVEYHPPVQQNSTVRNTLTLHRNTVTLVQTANPLVYLIQFDFTALVSGHISIYYLASESVSRDANGAITRLAFYTNGRVPGRTSFDAGERQRYRQNLDKAFDMRRYNSAHLRYVEGHPIPIVIRMQPTQTAETKDQVLSHLTYVEIILEDGVFRPSVVLQQVLVNGVLYRIHNMHGISGIHAPPDDPHLQRECVICLTEDSNTAVLPCNHLCLCDECARKLGTQTDFHRRKCPVCRTQLRSFLRIIAAPTEPSSLHSTSSTDGVIMQTEPIACTDFPDSPNQIPDQSLQNIPLDRT